MRISSLAKLSDRKSFRIAMVLLCVAILLSLYPANTAFAAPEDNITMEYRYVSGESVNIPDTISQGEIEYRLVSQDPPVLESSLPQTRTYRYQISGAVSQEDLEEIEKLGNVTVTPVYIDKEREVDKTMIVKNLPNNDVDYLSLSQTFPISSARSPSGITQAELAAAAVTYDVQSKASDGLPEYYIATIVYRGLETYSEIGYYNVKVVYSTEDLEGTEDWYVIIATYAPTNLPEEESVESFLPPEPVAETEFDDDDQTKLNNQTGNPLTDILNQNVPLGSPGIKGAWSVLSMMLSVMVLIAAVTMILAGYFNRRKASKDEEAVPFLESRSKLLKTLTILLCAMTFLLWLILDNMSFPMVWVNNHTILIMVAVVVDIALGIIYAIKFGVDKNSEPKNSESI